MGMQFMSVLVAGLLLGADPGMPVETVAQAQKDPAKATVVVTENATITISPGTKISCRPVKTGQGMRVKLEMPGVAIEAVRLRMESKGRISEIEIGQDGELKVRTFLQER